MNDRNAKKSNGLFDALKRIDAEERASLSAEDGSGAGGEVAMALDDTERTKVLSPGRLVAKRFIRNKLALVGSFILIIMFLFSFAGPILYPYSQTEIFYKYDVLHIDYASATERTEYILYAVPDGPDIRSTVVNRFNSYIADMEAAGLDETSVVATDDVEYTINKLGDKVYLFSVNSFEHIGTYTSSAEIARYDRFLDTFEWTGDSYPVEFQDAAAEAVGDGASSFEYGGAIYTLVRSRNLFVISLEASTLELFTESPGSGFQSAADEHISGDMFEYDGKAYYLENSVGSSYAVYAQTGSTNAYIASTFVFNSYDTSVSFSDEFKRNALFAIYGSGAFSADGNSYIVKTSDGDLVISDTAGSDIAVLSTYAIRRYSGQDTLSVDFKNTVQDVLERMQGSAALTAQFVYALQEIDASGSFVFDSDGAPVYAETEIEVARRNTGEYVLTCDQVTYLIDIFSTPNRSNLLGTDGDGMDILARMMYGGRISLLVGFIVVFTEILIGVILGGISGFFSGPTDTLIMRIADIFYCIPGYPILIIMGALFDKLKMDPYQRLLWMMVILGILGWATVARLVRGQILSLREQEFMHAQEATGMKNRRRIFRHLIPNVMPQLIVTATMGVGSIIIYESTLSFLGLGVKHPLATWGTMINSVTNSSEAMIKYTYIWLPVGILICLTVIAFNFAGDGLRDAFDPKMKR